eukprot:GFUD01127766.1.p1 GENE.GFUD01127766.1~~GFUD01127766.1.p1  ORF type:complete len:104 (-),score=7.59 GFUD01127766.1:30-317(-)
MGPTPWIYFVFILCLLQQAMFISIHRESGRTLRITRRMDANHNIIPGEQRLHFHIKKLDRANGDKLIFDDAFRKYVKVPSRDKRDGFAQYSFGLG